MFPPVEIGDRKYLGKPRLAIRYDITVRTVDRWIKAKILPNPDLQIRGRSYWDEVALDRHDRRAVAEHAAARNQPDPNPTP
jgi:hypothetical protein